VKLASILRFSRGGVHDFLRVSFLRLRRSSAAAAG